MNSTLLCDAVIIFRLYWASEKTESSGDKPKLMSNNAIEKAITFCFISAIGLGVGLSSKKYINSSLCLARIKKLM